MDFHCNSNARSPLGKGEVVSSILTGSTTKTPVKSVLSASQAPHSRPKHYGTTREQHILTRGLSVDSRSQPVPFRGRPKPTAVECVRRKGYLRPKIVGANCWRPALIQTATDKRNEQDAETIRNLWAPILCRPPWNKFAASTDCRWNRCFACGLTGHVHRAHIVARWEGGSDEARNLHLLCRMCHELSEGISGLQYWRWFRGQTMAQSIDYGSTVLIWKVLGESGHQLRLKPGEIATLAHAYAFGIDSSREELSRIKDLLLEQRIV